MRVTLVALIGALATPAFGAEKESWDFIKLGSEAQLSYGVPESEAVTLIFRCDAKTKPIEVITTVLPTKPKKGQALKTTLRNGPVTAAYEGTISHHSEHGFHFEASAPAEPRLVDVLKSGTTLTISVPGGKLVRVPLKGVAKPLAQFEAACLGKR